MIGDLSLYFSQLDEYNGRMIGNTTPAYTTKQVMAQSLILNNFVEGQKWYVDLVKNIAYYPRPLSAKQEAVLDKLINKITNGTATPAAAPAPLTVANAQNLMFLMRIALQSLKRPHIWIPLDPNKPITQYCDVLKITYKPASGTYSETLSLSVRERGMNTWIGDLSMTGELKLNKRRMARTYSAHGVITEALIQSTLEMLCQDPAGNTSKWGKLLSRCCYCFLPLSTAESLTAGYGPDCAKHYNLSWGAKTVSGKSILANAAHQHGANCNHP